MERDESTEGQKARGNRILQGGYGKEEGAKDLYRQPDDEPVTIDPRERRRKNP